MARIYPNKKKILLGWKQKLLSLYVIHKDNGISLYSHHFQLGEISHIDSQLVGMGFTALSKMMRQTVDPTSHISFVDLGKKKILFEERKTFYIVLVSLELSKEEFCVIFQRLKMLAEYFENMFILQQQITARTYVCLDDYALTSDLISLLFNEKQTDFMKIIPVIFRSIQKKSSLISKNVKESVNKLPESSFISNKSKNFN